MIVIIGKKLGQDIDGESSGDNFGWSVSLNADGTRVAIGAPLNDRSGNDSGNVRVYELDSSNNWQQLGQDIHGEAAGDQSGYSVSLSADGTRLAIGLAFNDGGGNDSGSVRVYKLDANNNWQKIVLDIDGEAAGDQSGYSVSLNAYGTRLAIGAPFNDGSGNDSGSVRVYQLDDFIIQPKRYGDPSF